MDPAVFIGPSHALDEWAPVGESFCDTIVVRSTASPERLMQAFFDVTLEEMPLARRLGRLRYLGARRPPSGKPFVEMLLGEGMNVLLSHTRKEAVFGLIGKLHQLRDQERYRPETPAQFADFHAPGYEKLVMSFRVVRVVAGTLLVLEHRTLPLDEVARRAFARYWRVIRPGGAFVTRQLLQATAARAERPTERAFRRAHDQLAYH